MVKRAVAWLCLLLCAACTSTLVDYEARTHVVQRGETLYTIAWRHGIDYRALARWNDLTNPDLIYVGQRLRLGPRSAAPARASPSPATGRSAASGPRRLPAPPSLPPPEWSWPTRGRIVSPYGAATGIASGIAIGGRQGQSIDAAAAGRVVYAGSGLIGYGQLVIIKHNDTYLSAYGHLSRAFVAQGDDVARGQRIAEMGLGPERQPRLHFEIRENGVPVDPTLHINATR